MQGVKTSAAVQHPVQSAAVQPSSSSAAVQPVCPPAAVQPVDARTTGVHEPPRERLTIAHVCWAESVFSHLIDLLAGLSGSTV